ncbi:hypothetical protein CcaverHIS002_0300630 [Cutaneotrichosporon cavernicola]|uniref:Uncharacterized protein n=1 Tax=Cutaneotrichosporon cavernicola TaxID=279322 RepID=A0AA48L2Q3_9TREE|nr:uncharacterized protein CcaverHIS019_0300630 [Cutaneotrichosporon cavernicola]BEI82195.1 hypothetical protein CcaverHIS002_0300630 [Cutaneotrichosporon cavernicola]BEI89993.1 hypothetical protein CcaverHIS019_0300630 [Cutaneotrichosporon cavernicola]BEI97765.1 hypothetical protein CcaverHIS631_0300640 [Cutaneotrichosporon cavernicola]
MHLTLVVTPSALHARMWDEARSVAATRVPLREMGVGMPPLDQHTLLTALDGALALLSSVDLATVTSVSGAAYPALVGDGVTDAFTPQADGVPLTKWLEHSLSEDGVTTPRWRAWGLDCHVLPFLPLATAAAVSTAPGPNDMVLLHDDLDLLVLPSSDVFQGSVVQDPNGRVGRMLLRDKYGSGRWNVLAKLAMLFAPGGSIGVDNKRFAFVRPFAIKAGTVRFEHGEPVDEFYDLRANTRCVLESQVLTYKQAAGTHCPARVILLTDEDNPAIPHLLASVFDCAVLAPLSPNTSTPAAAAAYGCALLAAGGDMVGVRALLNAHHAEYTRTPPMAHCKAPSSTLPTPPSTGGGPARLGFTLTTTSTPFKIQTPPSPAASDDGDGPEPWLRELERAPQDKWECAIYAAMMPEFTRVRALVDSGVIHPGTF